MHFDASPDALRQLNNRLRGDPKVIRWTMLKLGERLEDVITPKRDTVYLPNPRSYSSLRFNFNSISRSAPSFTRSESNDEYKRPGFH